jgi:hypothetical protein
MLSTKGKNFFWGHTENRIDDSKWTFWLQNWPKMIESTYYLVKVSYAWNSLIWKTCMYSIRAWLNVASCQLFTIIAGPAEDRRAIAHNPPKFCKNIKRNLVPQKAITTSSLHPQFYLQLVYKATFFTLRIQIPSDLCIKKYSDFKAFSPFRC